MNKTQIIVASVVSFASILIIMYFGGISDTTVKNEFTVINLTSDAFEVKSTINVIYKHHPNTGDIAYERVNDAIYVAVTRNISGIDKNEIKSTYELEEIIKNDVDRTLKFIGGSLIILDVEYVEMTISPFLFDK